jgi:uncharacterized membrane protein YbhN (UPF0104 family)
MVNSGMRLISSTLKTNSKRVYALFTVVFLVLVAYFLYQNISRIRWSEIEDSLKHVSYQGMLFCFILTVINYFVYACYDILSFNIIKNETLRLRKIISSTMIALAFNLNLGALVGSIGFRYRIYSGWGIPHAKIALLTAFSIITSWSGYVLLLATIFVFKPSHIVNLIPISEVVVQSVGFFFFLGIGVYFGLCIKKVKFKVQEHQFFFPPLHKAILQFLLSCLQWGIVAGIIHVFLLDEGVYVNYDQVLFSVLISGIAGVLTHIPAGLGVLETVFLEMHRDIPAPQIIAALILYRFVYYMIPLAIAVPGYIYIEMYQKNHLKRSFVDLLREYVRKS